MSSRRSGLVETVRRVYRHFKYRDARTGRYVTREQALRNESTTVREENKP